ncbi:MAG: WecB/TagA/CpsF family glycosyltransferase [Chlorobi bacterium]|nr:WecB/TagA/CpsF family glycosyltransferase [Chlorobiota bacterium]
MKNRIPILNVEVDNICKQDFLAEFKEGVLITPNVDHLMKLQKDKEFYDIYKKADYVTVDSKIVFLALKFLGTPVKEVITGSDFFPSFYNYHKDNKDIKIFLLGAMEGVADKAMAYINKKIGRGIVVGAHSPSFGFEKNEEECKKILDIINATDANVLVVGVGAPKQEKWIYKYKDRLHHIKIHLAIGATIDFEAGNIRRAPKVLQMVAMEWLYRLWKEPKRMWRRYIIEDMPFFNLIFKQKRGKYRNPFG